MNTLVRAGLLVRAGVVLSLLAGGAFAADDVVNKALEYVFTKDKEFQKFIDSPNDSKPLHPLRIKRSGDSTPKGRPGRKPAASVSAPVATSVANSMPASVARSAVK